MNKKLLVTLSVLLATSAITATGCKGGNGGNKNPSPVVDPISDIEVTKPTEDIIVGDVIDLDLYISVVGGSNPKAYDVTVRAGSEDVVSLSGHTLTVNAEGDIKLKVVAGDEESLVNWEAISQAKSAYKAATAGINKNYGLRDVSISSAGAISYTKEILVHNEEYFYQCYRDNSNVMQGNGSALLHDGWIYDYTTDATEAAGNLEFTAVDKQQGIFWDYYFVNMGFGATYDLFTTVVEEGSDGTSYEYLEIPATEAAPASYEDYAGNLADYVTLLTWGSSAYLINKQYVKQGYAAPFDAESVFIDIQPLETASGDTLYLLGSYVNSADGTKTYYMAQSILDASMHTQSVEDYIASETYPEAISFAEITTFAGKMAEATSYSQMTQIAGLTSAGEVISGSQLNCSLETMYDGNNKVLINTLYSDLYFETEEYSYGYFENNGKVYSFGPNEETGVMEAEETEYAWALIENNATTKVWSSVSTANITASSREEDTENDNILISAVDGDTYAFVAALVKSAPGYGSMFAGHMEGYEQYCTMDWSIANDYSSAQVGLDIPVNYGDTTGLPYVTMVWFGLGETDCSTLKASLIALIPAADASLGE